MVGDFQKTGSYRSQTYVNEVLEEKSYVDVASEKQAVMYFSNGSLVKNLIGSAVAERSGGTAFGTPAKLPKRRGASLPTAVQDPWLQHPP